MRCREPSWRADPGVCRCLSGDDNVSTAAQTDLLDGAVSLQTVRRLRAARHAETADRLIAMGLSVPAHQQVTWVGDLQQGDGGKGAMVDRLAGSHQLIVRSQGGDNAGHTTVFSTADGKDVVFKNHIIPSGLRHPGCIGVLGNGVLINAERLSEELTSYASHVPDIANRLLISNR